MPTKFLRQIPAYTPPVALTDTFVGVQGGTTDVQIPYSAIITNGSLIATHDMSFYVNSNTASNPGWGVGNDANDGLSIATPVATIQQCYNNALLWNYTGNWTPTLWLADGTYDGPNLTEPIIGGATQGYFNIYMYNHAFANVIINSTPFIGTGVIMHTQGAFTLLNTRGTSCINPAGGSWICDGGTGNTIVTFDCNPFTAYAIFFDPVPLGSVTLQNVTINVTAGAPGVYPTSGGWAGFVYEEGALGCNCSLTGCILNLPTHFLVLPGGDAAFVTMYSGGYTQQGCTINNFAGVNARTLFAESSTLFTDNGEISDIPGNGSPFLVNTDLIAGGPSGKSGQAFFTFAAPVTATDVPQSTWEIQKDSTGNCYVALNDAGALRLKQISRQPNTQTANYTLGFTDQDGRVEMNVAGANTVTVPPNSSVAFPVGTEIKVTQIGAGATTFVAGAGVTINNNVGVPAQGATAVLYKKAVNIWMQTGA